MGRGGRVTTHALYDPNTGILPCCGRHYLELVGTGDYMQITEVPDDLESQVDCGRGDAA